MWGMFFIPHISLTYLSHHPSNHAYAARSGYAYERLADGRVDVRGKWRIMWGMMWGKNLSKPLYTKDSCSKMWGMRTLSFYRHETRSFLSPNFDFQGRKLGNTERYKREHPRPSLNPSSGRRNLTALLCDSAAIIYVRFLEIFVLTRSLCDWP